MTGREFLQSVWVLIWTFFIWASYACVIVAGLLLPLMLPWVLMAIICITPIAIAKRALTKEKSWA
jgi:hypothetical protein